MKVGALVQARLGSTRLPGKVLMDLGGRPALDYLLERLAHAQTLQCVVVATSRERADDPVAEHCARSGISCHRGPHDDVAARLLQAADGCSLDAFVRVNGDSPLLDQRLVDRGVTLFTQGGRDLVTNVFPRSFPCGESVEVLRTEALRAALPRLTEPDDREHVTTALYRDPSGLVIENFTAGADGVGPDGGGVRLVLDTPDDAVTMRRILRAMERPHWAYGWSELLTLARGQTVAP